jgi:hypothetical protein
MIGAVTNQVRQRNVKGRRRQRPIQVDKDPAPVEPEMTQRCDATTPSGANRATHDLFVAEPQKGSTSSITFRSKPQTSNKIRLGEPEGCEAGGVC